jgi:hypothetical protein
VEDSINKYYDSYAANDGKWISFNGKKYYKSLGYVLYDYYHNYGNVFGVDVLYDAFTDTSVMFPVSKYDTGFDTFYAYLGKNNAGEYVFAEYVRDAAAIYEDSYTGYGFTGVVTFDRASYTFTRAEKYIV